MLLMLKVATLNKSLSVPVLLGASREEQPSSLFRSHYFTGGRKWKKPKQNARRVQQETQQNLRIPPGRTSKLGWVTASLHRIRVLLLTRSFVHAS